MVVLTITSDEIIQIDLHGLRFIEAKTEILDLVEGYCKQGYYLFEVIHGYQGGTVLRNYVRSSLKKDIERIITRCSVSIKVSSKGSTIITIKLG